MMMTWTPLQVFFAKFLADINISVMNLQVLKEASRLYCASWVRDIGPDLRPNDYKKNESEDNPDGVDSTNKQKELSTLEDLGKKFL